MLWFYDLRSLNLIIKELGKNSNLKLTILDYMSSARE
jgi:hypothetical protein